MTSLEEELRRLEVQTLDQSVRTNPKTMGSLLHEDFVEFGASGRRWSKASVLKSLSAERRFGDAEIDDFETRQLGSQHVLVTYTLTVRRDDRIDVSVRSSVWERNADGWLMIFHQGTTKS